LAQLGFTEHTTPLAVANMLDGIAYGFGEGQGAAAVVLQQIESHALSRLGAHAWQYPQAVDQASQASGKCRH
jgi:hypothetical protein